MKEKFVAVKLHLITNAKETLYEFKDIHKVLLSNKIHDTYAEAQQEIEASIEDAFMYQVDKVFLKNNQ
jgi:hypothetical protein